MRQGCVTQHQRNAHIWITYSIKYFWRHGSVWIVVVVSHDGGWLSSSPFFLGNFNEKFFSSPFAWQVALLHLAHICFYIYTYKIYIMVTTGGKSPFSTVLTRGLELLPFFPKADAQEKKGKEYNDVMCVCALIQAKKLHMIIILALEEKGKIHFQEGKIKKLGNHKNTEYALVILFRNVGKVHAYILIRFLPSPKVKRLSCIRVPLFCYFLSAPD